MVTAPTQRNVRMHDSVLRRPHPSCADWRIRDGKRESRGNTEELHDGLK